MKTRSRLHPGTLLKVLYVGLDRLTAPSPELHTETERQQARLLAALSPALLLLLILAGFIDADDRAVEIHTLLALVLGALILVFGLAHTRHYRIGVALLVISVFMGAVALTLITDEPYEAVFLVIPVFILSLYAVEWITGVLALVSIMLLLVMFEPHPEHYVALMVTLIFMLISMVLIVLTSAIRRQILTALEDRSRQLELTVNRFRAVVEGSMDSFYLLESVRSDQGKITDFRFIEVNQRGAAMVSRTREQIIGQLLCELLPVNRTGGFFDRYVRVVETRTMLEEEFPIDVESVTANWLHHQVIPVGDGIAITSRDITERKHVELVLRQSEARNRAIIKALPDMLFVLDRKGVCLDYHAPEDRSLFPLDETYIGRSFRDVLPGDAVETTAAALEQAFTTREPQVFEYPLKLGRRMGYRTVNLDVRLIAYTEDQVLAIIRDITDRRRSEQNALEVQMERERTRILSDFIRSASHEFRTPLAVINSGVNLMVRTDDPTVRQERAARIEEQVYSLAHLVDNLVLMSRLDSKASLDCKPLDLVSIARRSINELRLEAEKRKQQLILKTSPSEVCIQGDPELLLTALKNVVENSILYSPDQSEIIIQLEPIGDLAYVFVRDNGSGIQSDIVPQIFNRFYRGDPAHSTRGFGLGLPITKKIMELHGGEVVVESEPGRGSLFTLIFPGPGLDHADFSPCENYRLP